MFSYTRGDRLNDRYLLEYRLGVGGMGEVWRAHDLRLDRHVAVKLVSGVPGAGALREAQAAARLAHPHIAAVHDYVEFTEPGRGAIAYLVMELLDGSTLADRLADGPLPWPQVVAIGTQVASALAAAHAHGIVHQDIKPANIMLTGSGAKILDFGIAALTHRDHAPDQIAGTPAYTPPERLQHGRAEPSADIYSLAIVVHEMITGRVPWPVTTWEQARQLHEQPTPGPVLAGVPNDVGDLIRAALDPNTGRRPSANAFQQLLGQHRHDTAPLGLQQRPAIIPAPTLIAPRDGRTSGDATVTGHHPPLDHEADSGSRAGRSPGLIALAAVVLVLLVVGAVAASTALSRHGGTATKSTDRPSATAEQPSTTAEQPSATVGPSSEEQVSELLTTLREILDTAIDDGTIDQDTADDISGKIDDLDQQWQDGTVADFVQKCQELRDDLTQRAADEELDADLQQSLDAVLLQMISAAQRETVNR